MRRLAILAGLFIAISIPAGAQSLPKFELFGGYTYTHFTASDSASGHTNGWSVAPAFYPLKFLGVVFDLGGDDAKGYKQSDGSMVDAGIHSYRALIGPRFRIRVGRYVPFADFVVGGVYRGTETNSADYHDSTTGDPVPAGTELAKAQFNIAYAADGGIDYRLLRRLYVRGQVGWLHSDYTVTNAAIADPIQNSLTVSGGVVFGF
jgi:hypothetical protein